MARILLVDPNETARLAMGGILIRAEHRFATVGSAAQAWSFLRRNPGTDLVFTGLKLEGGSNGLALVQKLRADAILAAIPVVIYTAHGDRAAVQAAVALGVQNFLAKPYHDDAIFVEIAKAAENPWRKRFFTEDAAFCRATGFTPAARAELLSRLHADYPITKEQLRGAAKAANLLAATDQLAALREQAEAAGVLVLPDILAKLQAHAEQRRWNLWPGPLDQLDLALLLVADRLEDQRAAPDFYTSTEIAARAEAAQRAAWAAAPAAGRCPVVPWEQLQRQIAALPGCPVIDSAAASLQMIANGQPSSLTPLMDLVARDPGLSALVLVAANRMRPPTEGDTGPIENARLAVGVLGEVRLQALARQLAVTEERVMNLPPTFSWTRYWAFQRGVSRVARLVCLELGLTSLEPVTRAAGQLHDLGKLILAHLHPAGFQTILTHAREQRLPLAEAEKLYLSCTTAQIGAHFADHFGLSRRFGNVMRWVDDPAAATEDTELVAIVSLARTLCRTNRIGTSGDPAHETPVPLESTAGWQILRENLYPSFNLRKFTAMIHVECTRLRAEISGQQSPSAREAALRSSF
jgi:CheY-like chemotaxis protein/HD-like signal output (HDOD) protein